MRRWISFPLFVRGGGFIFRQPVVQNTGEMAGNRLRVLIAPAAESESTYYEDDGEEHAQYRQGDFVKRRFHQTENAGSKIVEISAPEGTYRPATRDLVLQMWMDNAPQNVTEQAAQGAGQDLPHLDGGALENTRQDGLLRMGCLR